MRTYVRRVARSIAKGDEHLADDLEQTTLLVALQKNPRDDMAARPWLFAICANTLRGLLVRDRFVLASNEIELPTVDSEPHELAVDVELRSSMQAALDELPPLQAEAVSLRYLDGLPPREVAARLGVPVETARSRIKRGLAQLRRDLQSSGVIERRTNVRWPLAFGVPTLFKRSRVAAVAGVVAIVGAVVVVDQVTSDRSSGLSDGSNVLPSPSVALTPVADPAGARTEASLLTDLRLFAGPEVLDRWANGVLVELSPASGESVVARIYGATASQVDGLEPGEYVARIDGIEVGRRFLEPGPQSWELTWGDGTELDVFAVTSTGMPAADVEIYERHPSLPEPRLVGRTDGAGRARVEVTSFSSWVAARGAPGQSSDSASVGSPVVRASGRVELEVVERRFVWSTLSLPDDPAFDGATFTIDVVGQRYARWIDLEHGAREFSVWLPLWTNGAGQVALAERTELWNLLLRSPDGELLWSSPGIRSLQLPDEGYSVDPKTTYRGRLLRANGDPVVSAELHVQAPFRRDEWTAETRTDERGEFTLAASISVPRAELSWRGATLIDLPKGNGEVVELGDLRLTGELTRHARVRVLGGGRFTYAAVPSWWRNIPAAYRLSGPVQPLDRRPIGTDGRFGVDLLGFTSAGVLVESQDDPALRRFVSRQQLRQAEGETVLDPSKWGATTVSGAVDPSILPCHGVLIEQDSGTCVGISVDPSTGGFRAEGLLPGTWCAIVTDMNGRTHWSRRALECEEGQTYDLGTILDEQARVRVMFPTDIDPHQLIGGKIRFEWAGETVASPRIGPRDVARGYLEHEVPPGEILVALQSRGAKFHASLAVVEGRTHSCWPRRKTSLLSILGWRTSFGSDSKTGRVEVFDDEGTLLASASVATAASRRSRRVVVAIPRIDSIRIVYHEGDVVREVRARFERPRFKLFVSVHPDAAQRQLGLLPDELPEIKGAAETSSRRYAERVSDD